ncbi:hypothetical protein TEA_012123 [Camellia sinensis var. sinensis]|uniref:USP domain-containing protein n=1 Tax=Camellia sinensis var. sinensis TaxID=542762 RepID=A0A4S4EJ30_CAMSN|nr:hypothetical protein TEA_012123 [Camellia sinensis var. sinensis]
MKDACVRYKNCALVYRAAGYVQVEVASLIANNVAKQRYLKNALDSARRAVSLSPNSLEFANFLVTLLYNASIDGQGYEEIVRECERALSIDDPIDPANESFHDDIAPYLTDIHLDTVEDRIGYLRQALQSTVQKCVIASSPPSTENLEIQKAIQTPEENLEINDPVAAATLSEQESDSEDDDDDDDDDVNAKKNKVPKRMKDAARKMFTSKVMRMYQRLSYWNSMSVEKRRGFLVLRICDLREHFGSIKDGLAARTFSEAIGFAQKHKTWKFWPCCFCDEKFNDSNLRMQHIEQEHKKSKLRYVDPQEVDANWARMLVNGTWKPVDIPGAQKIIEEQSKRQSADLVGDSDANLQPLACPNDQKWPLSNNVERAKILERIHDVFLLLLRSNCLSKSNLEKVIEDAMDELRNFVPLSQIHIHGLHQTPLCICFLEVSKLKKILQFLHLVSYLCGLNKNPYKGSSSDDVLDEYKIEEIEIKERIVFNGDSSCLLMDERLLQGEIKSPANGDAVADDVSAATCTIHYEEVDVLPGSDALVPWLFGPSIGEALKSWTDIQKAMKHQVVKVIQQIENEFCLIETWRRRKSELENEKQALLAVESICIEELKKRTQVTMHIQQSYASLLRRRQGELNGANNDAMSQSSRFEFDAILSILIDAQTLNVEHSQLEAVLTGKSSLKSSDHVHQEDACITLAITRQFRKGPSAEEQFEALVDEDAKQKADAVGEALLAEIALEDENNISKAGTDTKLPQKKLKSKKQKKNQRKKDPKVTQGDELYVLQEETEEQVHFPVGYDGDSPSSEIVVAVRAYELGLHGEELEHEVEERTLQAHKDLPDTLGPGLINDGENNCFLNVIVQSLWHLRTFRGEFLSISKSVHAHIGDPCVVCAIYDIFTALREAANKGGAAVSPTNLRIALSKLKYNGNFQEGQMNDASEALLAILDILHQSFTCGSGSDYAESPFDELLKLANEHYCDSEVGGCGKLNNLHHILSTPPHVFTTVLGWSTKEDVDNISAILAALTTEIDIGVIYEGIDPGNKHSLISMVCYCPIHFICFVYSRAYEKWILFEDKTVKLIGGWDDVLALCKQTKLQPQVLYNPDHEVEVSGANSLAADFQVDVPPNSKRRKPEKVRRKD